LRSVLDLIRLGNALVAALAAWVGGVLGASQFDAWLALKGSLAAFGVTAWGNIVNDIYDRDVDARHKAHRPIPSGRTSVRAARGWAAFCATFAIVLGAATAKVPAFALVLLALVLLWLYSRHWKGAGVAGHMVVALLGGLTFLFGALVQGEPALEILPQGWVAFAFALLWHLAREFVKAAEDVDSDRSAGVRTLAVRAGTDWACRAAAMALLALTALLLPPYLANYFNETYLVLVTVGVAPVLLASAVYLWSVPDSVRLHQLSRLLKFDMLVGIAALWFGLR
jgi:geranylgeranylglycerol-phosphate geranylgeranyltransferase